jgi:thioredoxin reductase (NADPH)
MYDCLVIGGGPAGLTAALYLSRYNRSAAVIDSGHGRWNTHEYNENYFGFPHGIKTKTLHNRGITQIKNFGAQFIQERVISITPSFQITTNKSTYDSRSLIFATGVTDIQPQIPNWQEFWGKSLFWCITCDGYKTKNKTVTIIGNSNDAAITALQFLNFTPHINFITNCLPGTCMIDSQNEKLLSQHNISWHEGCITDIIGSYGQVSGIHLDNNQIISTDFIFNSQGNSPNSDLAISLGVKTDTSGCILVNTHQKTNLPFVYAAGDVTKLFSHQIITAAHEGATAAESANYDLYEPFQKHL